MVWLVPPFYRIGIFKWLLKRFKIMQAEEEKSTITIAIITNHSDEAYLQKLLTTEKQLVTILSSSIDSNEYLKQLQTLQWFDYRKHHEIELFDLARTIISQGNSYLRGLPPSLESFIVPSRVKSIISMLRTISAIAFISIFSILASFIAYESTIENFIGLALFVVISIWTFWRITIEKEAIINRRISLSGQAKRFVSIFVPILVVSAITSLLSLSFLFALIASILLLGFILIGLITISWWFPTGDLILEKSRT